MCQKRENVLWVLVMVFLIQAMATPASAYTLDQVTGYYQDSFENPDGLSLESNTTLGGSLVGPDWADWDLWEWRYRTVYTIKEQTGSTLSNYSVEVNISSISNANGLVGSWHFNEGEGTRTRDYSGNNNDGTISGASWTRGKYGTALEFDGVNDYVDIGTDSSLHVDTFTFVAWIKWSGNTNGVQDIIFNKEREYEWCIGDSGSGAPTGHLAWAINTAGTWEWHDTGYTVPANEWVFLVLTYDGTHVRLYVNGELESTLADPDGGPITDSSYPLWIGRRQNLGSPTGEFSGVIDEVRIYNRVLTDQEIRDLYTAKKARPDLGDIRAYYKNPSTGEWEETGYYLETDRRVWVNIPELPAGANTSLRIYHGNPLAESESNESITPGSTENNPLISLVGTEERPDRAMAESITIIPEKISGWEAVTIVPSGGSWYKREIVVREESGVNRSWYQVPVVMDTATLISDGKMRSDCGDLRFVDEEGNALPYWIADGCNTPETLVWVVVPFVRANTDNKIYAFYGNPSATTESSQDLVGLFYRDMGEAVYFFDFEGGTDGWQTALHGDNGGTSVDTSMAFHGSSSIKSYQPNTGSPSHHHFYTSLELPYPWFRVGWAAYIVGKQNSGSANQFRIDTVSQIDSTPRGFLVNMVQSKSTISAWDGDGSGGGTMTALEPKILGSWVWSIVEGDFSTHQYYVIVRGKRYGPFGFVNNVGPSEIPVLELMNDNYLGYLDAVWVREYYPPVTVFLGSETMVGVNVSVLNGATHEVMCTTRVEDSTKTINISSCASGASSVILRADWDPAPPEYLERIDEWEISWNTNLLPSIESGPVFTDHEGHSFDISATASDPNGDTDFYACYVDMDKGGTVNTYSGVLNRSYGNESQASCTMSIDTGMLDIGESALFRVRFVDNSGGTASTPYVEHAIPNYAPTVVSGPTFSDNSGEHSFSVTGVFNDRDGEGDITLCTVHYSDGEGNDYSRDCTISQAYGNTTEVSCSYSPIGTDDPGLEVGEPVSVWIECRDAGSETVQTPVKVHSVPNQPPSTPQDPVLSEENASRVTTLHPRINWSTVADPEGDTLTIIARVDSTSPPGTIDNQASGQETTMTLGWNTQLERGETYYWTIEACDNWSCSPATIPQNFTINSLPVLYSSGLNDTSPTGGENAHLVVNISDPDGDAIEYVNFTIWSVTQGIIVNDTTGIPINNTNGTYQGGGEWWSPTFVLSSSTSYNWTIVASDGHETIEFHGSFATGNSPPSCDTPIVFSDALDEHEFNATTNCTEQEANDIVRCEFVVTDSQGNTSILDGLLAQIDEYNYSCSITINQSWPGYYGVLEPLTLRARFYDTESAFGESPAGVHAIPDRPPVVTSAIILPDNPNTTSTLSVSYEYTDPEGDQIATVEYSWKRNGTDTGLYGPTVAYYETKKHENWSASIRVTDEYGARSVWYNTSNTTILDSPPVVTSDIEISYGYGHEIVAIARATDSDGTGDVTGCVLYMEKGGNATQKPGVLDCSIPGECECTATATPSDAPWITVLGELNLTVGFVDSDDVERNTSRVAVIVPNQEPTIEWHKPENNTITRNNTIELSWNVTDRDNDTINTTIRIYHENGTLAALESTTGNETTITLSDGTYHWTITASDNNQNTTIGNNTLTIDSTPPLIEWNGTLPETPTEKQNTTCTWNATDATTGIATVLTWDNKTREWKSHENTTTITHEIDWFHATPGRVNCTITVTDQAGNNATDTRIIDIRDVTPPSIIETSTNPSTPDDIDPGVTLSVSARVTDNHGIKNVVLYYKKSNQTDWNTIEMNHTSGDVYEANITPQQGNYTLLILAVDEYGNNASIQDNIEVEYDYSWRIQPEKATIFGTAGDTPTNLTIRIENTGDYPLGFIAGHSVLYSSPAIEVEYLGISPSSVFLVQPKQEKEFNISVTSAQDGMNTIILSIECVNTSTPATRKKNVTIEVGIALEGPYLYVRADDPQPALPGRSVDLVFTLENIGTEEANHTGYEISLPEGWTTEGASTKGETGRLGVMESVIVPVTISVPTDTPEGEYTISIKGIIYNETIETINTTDENNQTIQENVTVLVPWRNTTRTIKIYVVSATHLGSTEIVINKPGKGGGGGSSQFIGGYFVPTPQQEDLLFQTTETIELVRGRDNNFTVRITNPFRNTSILNATLEVTGYLSKYLRVSPEVIPEIPPGEEREFIVNITAPKYMTERYYTLSCVIQATVKNQTNGATGVYRDEKTIILVIHTVSREEALSLILEAKNQIQQLASEGLETTRMARLISQAEAYYDNHEYARAAGLARMVIEECNNAIRAREKIRELKQELENIKNKGLEAPETERMYEMALASFERGDYDTTLARVRDAESLISLETKGKVNILYYLVKYWWATLGGLVTVAYGAYRASIWIQKATIARRIKRAEALLEQLFQEREETKRALADRKIGQKEYHEEMARIEKRIVSTNATIASLKQKRAKLFDLDTEIRETEKEIKELEEAIKRTQRAYYHSRSLTREAYETRTRTYRERLAEARKQLEVYKQKKMEIESGEAREGEWIETLIEKAKRLARGIKK